MEQEERGVAGWAAGYKRDMGGGTGITGREVIKDFGFEFRDAAVIFKRKGHNTTDIPKSSGYAQSSGLVV